MSSFRGTPRCGTCACSAIDGPELLAAAFQPVQRALEKRGLRIRSDVKVILRSTEKLVASGAFQTSTTCGVTVYRKDHKGALVGGLAIAIAAGHPRIAFESTAAHEWAHAFMADRGRFDLPPQLSEGFAEFIAHEYLVRDRRGFEAEHHARLVSENPDQIYGGGYRRVRLLVDRVGAQAVYKALALGRLDAIASWEKGLSLPRLKPYPVR